MMFAFDPRRMVILLIGGDKSPDGPRSPNWNRWYDHYTPIADDLYDTHLEELRTEDDLEVFPWSTRRGGLRRFRSRGL